LSANASNSLREFREKLILKEMEISHSSIKNLDDIIYKTKNFAFLAWGGSLALLVKSWGGSLALLVKYVSGPNLPDSNMHWLILLTGLIPLMFWSMDYWWRKHLRMAGRRERRLSLFINGEDFEKQVSGASGQQMFPYCDHVGWIYTRQALKAKAIPPVFADKHLGDKKEFGIISTLFYKDGWIYYLGMTIISILFWYIGFKP
jgi:hypothetical protein